MRQRLQLAAACLHRPEVMILDEPTSGVDPAARDMFWRLLGELSRRDGLLVGTAPNPVLVQAVVRVIPGNETAKRGDPLGEVVPHEMEIVGHGKVRIARQESVFARCEGESGIDCERGCWESP